jgi:protein gp37
LRLSQLREFRADWACSLRDQCQQAGVPFLFKQWGEFAPAGAGEPSSAGLTWPVATVDPAGRFHSLKLGVLAPEGSVRVHRYGKRRAGRELDGCTWDQYPESSGLLGFLPNGDQP